MSKVTDRQKVRYGPRLRFTEYELRLLRSAVFAKLNESPDDEDWQALYDRIDEVAD